ncbi:MAG: hypothetical protein ACI308_06525 [Muribaculaceae bacterium]
MTTEEKLQNGMNIYADYRRKYYEGDFFSACERQYVSSIIEACELNFYDRLIPKREMYLALDYCQRANRAVNIVLDAPFLSGEALAQYRERHRGNRAKLASAGRHANQIFDRSFHIEYVARPLSLISSRMHAFLSH